MLSKRWLECAGIFLPACTERNKAVDKYVADRIKNARLEVDKREYIISNFDKYCANFKAKSWNAVVLAGLKACGYIDKQRIKSVVVQSCDCEEAG